MEFSRELRSDVLAGDITRSVRLWKRPRVKQGGRYPVGVGEIEVDSIELVPYAPITEGEVRRAGEPARETLRQRSVGLPLLLGEEGSGRRRMRESRIRFRTSPSACHSLAPRQRRYDRAVPQVLSAKSASRPPLWAN